MEIMRHADKQKLVVLILSIDFEKCFDMVDYSAIKGSLTMDLTFHSTSGVHQGCWLINLIGHIVAHLFESNQTI